MRSNVPRPSKPIWRTFLMDRTQRNHRLAARVYELPEHGNPRIHGCAVVPLFHRESPETTKKGWMAGKRRGAGSSTMTNVRGFIAEGDAYCPPTDLKCPPSALNDPSREGGVNTILVCNKYIKFNTTQARLVLNERNIVLQQAIRL